MQKVFDFEGVVSMRGLFSARPSVGGAGRNMSRMNDETRHTEGKGSSAVAQCTAYASNIVRN